MKKAIVILAFLTACGGSNGWSDSQRNDYLAGCEDGGADHNLCVCMQEKVEAAYPDPDKLPDSAELNAKSTEWAKECVAANK
jgi:hypothetical protein